MTYQTDSRDKERHLQDEAVEQRLSYIRNRITEYPSETAWVRIDGEEKGR